jgi:hypothetical protein
MQRKNRADRIYTGSLGQRGWIGKNYRIIANMKK